MINLFGYQQPALDAIINAFKRKTAVLAVMATGLGKTIIAAFWAKKEINNGQKGLFICHNNGILDQAIPEFREVLGEKAIFKPFYGLNKDFDVGKANIVFASFQTYVNWKETFLKDGFDFIIVDESHHIQAETYKEVITYFKPKKLLGLTATPDRADLKDIREIFGKEVVDYSLEKSIAEGWLTPVDYHILNDNLDHSKLHEIVKEVLQGSRSVSIKDLNETIFIKKRDEEIARQIREYAGKDKKAIIFCEKIEHAENFQRFLPNSLTYHSKLSDVENKRRLTALREGSLQYILTVNKFNEGIDVPDVEMVVFLRCTESKTIFYQQLGRGLRKNPGKEKVIILDFVANCERLAVVKNMVEKIKEESGNGFTLNKNILHVTGKSFDFVFSRNQIDILNLIKRINEPFYETWQEAGKAAKKLGISSVVEYWKGKKYRQDPKLHSAPERMYKNFPGWKVFLGGKKNEPPYKTWQKAGRAARQLGISTIKEYWEKYRQDPKLPSSGPNRIYKNFPGWRVFLGGEKKEFYTTWQEAGKAAKGIKISSRSEYKRKYKKDHKLPSAPDQIYKNFPGWEIFLETKLYDKWQKAGRAARQLGISTVKEYKKKYKQNPKLPSYPSAFYQDYPGWEKFLGKERRKKVEHKIIR